MIFNYLLFLENMLIQNMLLSFLILIAFNSNSFFIKSFITLPFSYINKNTSLSVPNTTTLESYFESFLTYPIFTNIKINEKISKIHLTLDRHATYISESNLKEIDAKASISDNKEDLYSLDYIGIPRTTFTKSPFSFIVNNTKNITLNNYSFFMAINMSIEQDNIKKNNYYAEEKDEIGLNIYKGNKVKKVEVEEDDPYEDFYPDPKDDDIDEGDYEYGSIYYQNRNKSVKGIPYINKNNGYNIEQNSNIINQLKSQKLISSYAFMVKYKNKNDEKGKIIIGGLPHEYDPRHYSEKYYISGKVSFSQDNPGWKINFQNIMYGNDILVSVKQAEFSLNFGFISTSNIYKEFFDRKFFNNSKYLDSCKEKNIGFYTVKYCKEKVIKEFNNLTFILANEYADSNSTNKIEFDYKDLFVKAPGDNDFYYFQIVFMPGNYKWLFGRPVFKKYPVVFDQDKRIIGFYTQTGEYEVQNIGDKNDEKTSFPISWILVILLSIIVIILGITFYLKLPYLKRKKKANELDDDFDYQPASENKNENEKNKLFN